MKSYRPFAMTVFARGCHPIACSLALCFLFSFSAFGQQPQPKKRVPVLTTEDVVRERPQNEVVSERAAEGKKEAKPGDAATGTKTAGDAKPNPEQAAWRARVEKAREKVKATQRAAEEAELRANDLRNRLGDSGGTPRDRNQTAGDLEQMGQRVKVLRAEARTAEEELNAVLAEAKAKGFTESEGPKAVGEGGRPNEDYYKTRFAKLNEAAQDSQRKMQLYEIRVRDLTSRMNNTSGDRFSGGQVQQELEEAQQKLSEARSAQIKAQSDINALREEARRAGVPAGLFR